MEQGNFAAGERAPKEEDFLNAGEILWLLYQMLTSKLCYDLLHTPLPWTKISTVMSSEISKIFRHAVEFQFQILLVNNHLQQWRNFLGGIETAVKKCIRV